MKINFLEGESPTLKETGEGLFMFKFKLGNVEEQLFMAVSVDSNKMGFYGRCPTDFYKLFKSCIIER